MMKWLKKYNILLRLLSLVGAIILWFFVMSVINPDITITFKGVKVTFKGQSQLLESRNFSILSSTDVTLDVSLRGKRNDILKIKKSDVYLECDVSGITSDGENIVYCTTPSLNSDITVINKSNLKVTVVADTYKEKEIQVYCAVKGTDKLGDNLSAGTPEPVPATVTVKGAQTEVNSISHALATVDVSGMTDSQTVNLPLTVIVNNGNELTLKYSKLMTEAVDVKVPIYLEKDIPLSVNINPGGGLTENEVLTSISPASIRLKGERSDVENIERLSLGMIDLEGINSEAVFTKAINIPSRTSCVGNDSIATINVQVKDITTKSIEISNIELRGSAGKYRATLAPGEKVTVRVKGNATLLNAITAENISAFVDLTSLLITKEGQYEAAVTAELTAAVNAEVLDDNLTATVVMAVAR